MLFRSRTDTDVVDPDPEEWMPISKAAMKEAQGKIPHRGTIRHQPDGPDSDCEILEVLDPMPLQFTFPLASTSAENIVDVPPLKTAGRTSGTSQRVAAAGPRKRKNTDGPKPARKRRNPPKQREAYTGYTTIDITSSCLFLVSFFLSVLVSLL